MNPSHNLFLIGPTGAGKTSIGRRLAAHYGLTFVDLDQEIERHCGVDVNTVFEIEGEAGFRQRESTLLDECSRRPGVLLATGAGVVLAPHNRQHLRERGYVVCEVSPGQWRSDYRTVEYVTRPGAPLNTRASFVMTDGDPKLHKA